MLAREATEHWTPGVLFLSSASALVLGVGADRWSWIASDLRPDASGQGATVYALLGLEAMLAAIGLLMAGYISARNSRDMIVRPRNNRPVCAMGVLCRRARRIDGAADARGRQLSRADLGAPSWWSCHLGGAFLYALHRGKRLSDDPYCAHPDAADDACLFRRACVSGVPGATGRPFDRHGSLGACSCAAGAEHRQCRGPLAGTAGAACVISIEYEIAVVAAGA